MFGFSPLMMGGKATPPPFSYSGSWETGIESWQLFAGMGRASGAGARTGTFKMQQGALGTGYMTRIVPGSVCAGLTITASVWSLCWNAGRSGPVTRTLSYQIGSGSLVTLQTVSDSASAYALLSGSFLNPAEEDVTIHISGQAVGDQLAAALSYFDDWSIEGSLS